YARRQQGAPLRRPAVSGADRRRRGRSGRRGAARPPQPMNPNVLLISLDTLRFDCVRAVGERRFLGALTDAVASPAIDALAAAGAVFPPAVSAAPFTTPSHASLFTGLGLPQHGAHHQYRTPIAMEARTLAERLAAAGYRTAMSAGRDGGEGVMFASDV